MENSRSGADDKEEITGFIFKIFIDRPLIPRSFCFVLYSTLILFYDSNGIRQSGEDNSASNTIVY
jgi:hypothetical protein